MVHVAQRGGGGFILGDNQKPSGYGPRQMAVDHPDSAGALTR